MSDSPLVTIGLPVYNSERYVRQSIDSLLAQTFRDFVLVISDNASTDSTAAICQEYAAKDARVKYHRNPVNIGNPRNFNRVFELTTTPYLKWSTSDDWWKPTFVEQALEVMEREPDVALCYPKACLVDADGSNARAYDDNLHLAQDDPADRFLALVGGIGLIHQHLGLIRTSFLRRTHLLGAHLGSDFNLLAELSLYGKFYELPGEPLFYRRFHDKSGSWKRADAKHAAKHYHGSGKNRGGRTKWPGHVGLLKAVGSAPIPLGAKARIYPYLFKRIMWDRAELWAEFRAPKSA